MVLDVMSDVAFPCLDLEAHGRRDLAFGSLYAHLQRSGDYTGVEVLRFCEAYRALQRSGGRAVGSIERRRLQADVL
jgi:aminoglycoside phosphotransferase family enzyme